jgi:hypothetical protein
MSTPQSRRELWFIWDVTFYLFFSPIKERSYSLDLDTLPTTDKANSERRGSKKEVKTF